jgi:hypothetical protein
MNLQETSFNFKHKTVLGMFHVRSSLAAGPRIQLQGRNKAERLVTEAMGNLSCRVVVLWA